MHFSWSIAQIGAREHYAVARALHRLGALSRLYTDAWWYGRKQNCCGAPAFLRDLRGRYHAELPSEKVTAFNLTALFHKLRRMRRRSQNSLADNYADFIEVGKTFALQVTRRVRKVKLDARTSVFFGYNTGCLETLHYLRGSGIFYVLDQIDPARLEEKIVDDEIAKWPGWQTNTGHIPKVYWDRVAEEWALADMIVVNSEWSRNALISQGVAKDKLVVVPLAYETRQTAPDTPDGTPRRKKLGHATTTLTVLSLGQVNLRKGIQYLVEAARLLEGSNILFVVAGPIQILPSVVAAAPRNMKFVGRVSRDRIGLLYDEADLFVLPTLSDGFAITQLEAMAYGLPVIATARCGEVVSDSEDGWIIPAGDGAVLAERILQLHQDRTSLSAMSARALSKVGQFSLESYAHRLEAAVHSAKSAQRAGPSRL